MSDIYKEQEMYFDVSEGTTNKKNEQKTEILKQNHVL